MYTYSFIIPHHNTPDLLNRCLDSIPQREDIQIIVVDDNSDYDKKPQIQRSDVLCIFIRKEESKWAGHARNVGLQQAIGNWILFADADDFYAPNFIEILDANKNTNSDVVYYNVDSVNSETLQPANRTEEISKIMLSYFEGKSQIDEIKYRCRAPWNKMVKRSFIQQFHITFEEICKGNDMRYSFAVGYFSRNIDVVQDIVYICTYRVQSMTFQKRSLDSYVQSLENYFKIRGFFDFVGHKDWPLRNPFLMIVSTIKKCNVTFSLRLLILYFKKYNILKEKTSTYPNLFRHIIEDK